mmetsp:Transcript_14898/g.19660  ORF Transcript_14898/g.19660 Transcript_14898/m.19660 type:complete len:232 (-) Transcript_14898:535-1230(-)
MLACCSQGDQATDILRVALLRAEVPKDNNHFRVLLPGLGPGRPRHLVVGVDQGVGAVTPLVVWTDVGKVDVSVHCQSNPQPTTLPTQRRNTAPGHLQGFQQLAKRGVELHHRDLPHLPTLQLRNVLAGQGEDGPVGVPPALGELHAGVQQHWRVVLIPPRDLHTPVRESHCQGGRSRVLVPLRPIIPVHSDNRCALLHVGLSQVFYGRQRQVPDAVPLVVVQGDLPLGTHK